MLKKLQSLKAKKGFTLVELIVVIAIIAVLAAILVPTMMGYVTSSRVTSLDSTAASLKDTVGNAMVEADALAKKVPTEATVYITGTGSGVAATVIGLLSDDAEVTYPDLVNKINGKLNDDYNFGNKTVFAVVHIKDRKVVACAYTDDANMTEVNIKKFTLSVMTSGNTDMWNGKTDGVGSTTALSGALVGTSPKLTYNAGTTSTPSGGTSEA